MQKIYDAHTCTTQHTNELIKFKQNAKGAQHCIHAVEMYRVAIKTRFVVVVIRTQTVAVLSWRWECCSTVRFKLSAPSLV